MRQEKQLRIGTLKNFSGVWGIRIVPSCLILGHGMIKQGKSGSEYMPKTGVMEV